MASTNKSVRLYRKAYEAVTAHMARHGSGQNEAASLLVLDGARWQARVREQKARQQQRAEQRKTVAK